MKSKMLLIVLSSAMFFSTIPTYAQTPIVLQINNTFIKSLIIPDIGMMDSFFLHTPNRHLLNIY